jgi:hypothetical protein
MKLEAFFLEIFLSANWLANWSMTLAEVCFCWKFFLVQIDLLSKVQKI